MSNLRAGLRAAGFLVLLAFCVPAHIILRATGRRSHWPRRFLAAAARTFGMRMRIVGRPAGDRTLYVANHRSWMDILLMAGSTGSRFVSKDDVKRWPLVGWLAGLNDTIFIARTRRSETLEQADTLRQALAEGQPVTLFPEGTTHGGNELLPFRASLFAAVAPPPPGLVVQPVLIDYGTAREDIRWGSEGAAANFLKILRRPGTADVTLRFLEPIEPGERDRKAIAGLARERMSAAMAPARG